MKILMSQEEKARYDQALRAYGKKTGTLTQDVKQIAKFVGFLTRMLASAEFEEAKDGRIRDYAHRQEGEDLRDLPAR